jgi:integrase/recombinase XerD
MLSERLCLPVEQWPALDQRLWRAGIRAGELFEPAGAGAHWSPRSCDKTARGYGRWLTWLGATSQLVETIHPGDRVTRARVIAYLDVIAATCAPFTLTCRIQELCDALRVLAPRQDRGWLDEVLTTLRLRATPIRDKRRRLRPVADLIALGRQLMDEAETAPEWSPRRRAIAFRDGLMITLLAYRPVRRQNFAAIRLGRHLVRQDNHFWLLFAAAETKTHTPYEAVIPDALVAALQRYLDYHRLVLLRGERGGMPADLDALWISEVASPLEVGALGRRIAHHTRTAFGASLPAHWFRDAAATTIAIEDPKHARDAQHVLGHASHRTTERHYNQACSLEASRRHQALLTSLRSPPKGTPI